MLSEKIVLVVAPLGKESFTLVDQNGTYHGVFNTVVEAEKVKNIIEYNVNKGSVILKPRKFKKRSRPNKTK